MNVTKVLLFCCFLMLNTLMIWGSATGWIQTHATTGRSRNSELGQYEFQNNLIKSYNLQLIPNSILMNVNNLNFCALSVNPTTGQQEVVGIDRDGALIQKKVRIPQDYAFVNVLPVMDDKYGYYTVRKNTTSGVSFVLKSSVMDMTNQILLDTKTKNQINSMILTDYGLVISSGFHILNIDRNDGTGKWMADVQCALRCQLLFDTSSSVPKLFVMTDNSVTAIHAETGAILDKTRLGFLVNLAPNAQQQPFLTVGKDYLVIPNTGTLDTKNLITVLDRNNLKRFYTNILVKGVTDLSDCSNFISRNTNSFFFVCNTYYSFSAFRYDISNTTVSLGYEIDTRDLFGVSPKVCSNQIAAFGKSGFYGMACDVGVVSFHQDNIYVPRRDINIQVNQNTQVFGTLGKFALVTSDKGQTLLEAV